MASRRVVLAPALLAFGAAWLVGLPGLAASPRPMNVADLVRSSTEIVVGTVTEVTASSQPGQLPFTEVRLSVSESIRGPRMPDGRMTFRQFGLPSPAPASDGRRYVGLVAGLPTYRVGDEVVLFLGPVSTLGLRTTAGFQQGKFVANAGNLQNDVNNAGLFLNVPLAGRKLNDREQAMVETHQGAVRSETFLGLVRRAVNEHWWDAAAPATPRPGAGVPASLTPSTTAPSGEVR